ncbi:MAG: hypothetical protein J6E46_13465 [Faecalicoccus sp.]|nr:hypothetical protein [Faecalicoccus sp.]
MSEIITKNNIDLVIQKNRDITYEICTQVDLLRMNPSLMNGIPIPQLGILILKKYGLIQMPVEDPYWSGAIFIKEGKTIPVINTALPRVNQYFSAWHEVYHLLFDQVSFDHVIESDNTLEERKAEYFAAKMLLGGVERYFCELPEMDFLSKVLYCMSAYQAPYKAVLVSLYEYAVNSENQKLQLQIKEVLDIHIPNFPQQFSRLGLDDSLVKPSYVVDTSYLQHKIQNMKGEYPELKYHEDNEEFLENIMREIHLITGKGV